MGSEPAPISGIRFLPIGPIDRDLVEAVVSRVSGRVALPCRLGPPVRDSGWLLVNGRQQIDADAMLVWLETHHLPGHDLIVGLTMDDIGTSLFSFIFGRSRLNSRVALVSLARLRPEYYGLPADVDLTLRRACAEVLHEAGHALGLIHCVDIACLMKFATNVESIDLRGETFCAECRRRLQGDLLADGQDLIVS